MDNVKIFHLTEFPIINRVLFIGSITGEDATVRVIEGSTGHIISSKAFYELQQGMNYYNEQLNNLESAEEYETMRYAFKMLYSMES